MKAASPKRLSIIIADDHQVLAEGLLACLAPHYDVVGLVTRLDQLEAMVVRSAPDVALVDITFERESALPLVARLNDRPMNRTRFLVLTAHDSPAFAEVAARAGVVGYLLKGANIAEVRTAIEAAAHGHRVHPTTGLSASLDCGDSGNCWPVGGIELNDRQVEILCLFLEGHDRTRVASRVRLSAGGVDYHTDDIRARTGLRDRSQLMAWATEHHKELLAIRAALDPTRRRRRGPRGSTGAKQG